MFHVINFNKTAQANKMTQASVAANKDMKKKITDNKRGRPSKRPSSSPKPESKKHKMTKERAADMLYGSFNAIELHYTDTYMVIEKNQSTYRLYPRHLKALQSEMMQLCTAMQDGTTTAITLPSNNTIAVEQFETGHYIKLSRPLEDGKMWSLSLKFDEFTYLLENLDALLARLKKGDSIPKTAETEIASTDLYDDAVRTFSDLVSEELGRLKMSKCYGCSIQHPSQKQHDCLVESTVQMIEELLDEAIECVQYEKFKKALETTTDNKHLAISVKLLWQLCLQPAMISRVKDVVMVPYVLRDEIDQLSGGEAAA
jgi:hypothetical protein